MQSAYIPEPSVGGHKKKADKTPKARLGRTPKKLCHIPPRNLEHAFKRLRPPTQAPRGLLASRERREHPEAEVAAPEAIGSNYPVFQQLEVDDSDIPTNIMNHRDPGITQWAAQPVQLPSGVPPHGGPLYPNNTDLLHSYSSTHLSWPRMLARSHSSGSAASLRSISTASSSLPSPSESHNFTNTEDSLRQLYLLPSPGMLSPAIQSLQIQPGMWPPPAEEELIGARDGNGFQGPQNTFYREHTQFLGPQADDQGHENYSTLLRGIPSSTFGQGQVDTFDCFTELNHLNGEQNLSNPFSALVVDSAYFTDRQPGTGQMGAGQYDSWGNFVPNVSLPVPVSQPQCACEDCFDQSSSQQEEPEQKFPTI